jgi:type I restriction enzyme S subunit
MGSEMDHKVKFRTLLVEPVRNGIYKQKQFHGRGCKIINMGELFGFPRLYDVPMKRVELTEKEQSKSLVQQGDLLFARRSLVAEGAGKCSIVSEVNEPTTFESSIIRARPNPALASSGYLYYFFSSPLGRERMATILRQMAVSGITGSDLMELEIECPELEHQKKIATFLSALDDRIALLQETNITLEAIAEALFKSWFVDFDPVRAKAEGVHPKGMDARTAALFPDSFVESEEGLIPKGWKCSNVGKSFILTMGQSPPGDTYNESGEGLSFYQGRTDFGFRFPTQRIFCSAPTRLAEAGDTLVSVRAPVGDVNVALQPCALGRGVASVRHPNGHQSFVFYSVRSLKPHFELYDGEGTVFGSINKKDFQALPVFLPDEPLLEAFGGIAAPLDAGIESNEKRLRALIQLRDILLPRLISGQLRLTESEEMVGEICALARERTHVA